MQAEIEQAYNDRLKRSKEAYLCRIDYLKAQYDLEKKRMSAEMEECKRMDFNRTP